MNEKIEKHLNDYKGFIKKSILEFTGKVIDDNDEKLLKMLNERKVKILDILKNGVDVGSLITEHYKVKDIVIKDNEYYFKLDIRSKYNLLHFREAL